jgi:hypothetical protein
MKYKKKTSIRGRQIEVSLAVGDKKKKYQLRISNLNKDWLDEVDYTKHNWIDIYNGEVLRIRITKDNSAIIIIDKQSGKWFSIKDPIKIKHFKSDLRKAYRSMKA